MNILLTWVIASLVMLLVDAVWILAVMKRVYAPALRSVQGSSAPVRVPFAVAAYAAMAAALLLISWQTVSMPLWQASLIGAAWGAVLYGTYAFTVAAIFPKFPARVAAADFVWGAVLFGVSVGVGVWLTRLITRTKSV